MEIFIELTLIVALATGIGLLMKVLKQPLIVGYILAGILSGPMLFNVVHSTEEMELFSKIGITVLLFIVGLNLSPKVILEVGKVSLLTGVGQIFFTTLIGFSLVLLFGFDWIASLYIALALTFSSTIIILKFLADKGDLEKLYGKIAIGFLLVQDIVATLIILLVSSFSESAEGGLLRMAVLLVLKAVQLLIVFYLVSRYLLPKIGKFVASSSELLFLFSLTWGLGLASLFYVIGFSVEIGALVAGVTLSMTPFSYEIASRLKPLRDFFVVIFFVLLGSQMVFQDVMTVLFPAVVLSFFVLIGNPVILFVLVNLVGYKRKTAFMAGITTAQISEFSLILIALAFSLGHISQTVLSLITVVGLITIAGSSYMMLYGRQLYRFTEKFFAFFEIRKIPTQIEHLPDTKYELILFGYDRVGQDFLNTFRKLGHPFLVVDHNPMTIEHLQEEQIPFRYGEVEDIEFLDELHFEHAKLVVSTIPDLDADLLLLQKVSKQNPKAIIIVIAKTIRQAKMLYAKGASYVVMPHYLGAHYAANMITRFGLDKRAFLEEREKHLQHIEGRREE